jgi:benzoylformate decarboxylase
MDDWDAPAAPRPARAISRRTAPDPAALDRVADLLRSSHTPVIVAGPGIDRSGGWEAAVGLAERLEAPVWSAPAPERAGFPQTHRLFQGFLPLAIGPIADALAPYDFALVFGAPIFRYYPYIPGPFLAEGTRLVLITDHPDEAARAPVGDAVIGDIALAMEGLLTRLERLPTRERVVSARDAPAAAPPTEPMSPAYVLHALAATMPAETIVVEESASTRGPFYDQIRIAQAGGYFATGSGGLGYAVPAAVGVQLARPERPVVCVVGDGAAMYAIQALWTAAHERAPVVYVVLNNGHYAILKAFAAFGEHGDRIPGLDLPHLDIAAIARGFGCAGRRVERAADLPAALRHAFAARADGVPTLLDVAIDATVPDMFPRRA